MLYIILAVLFGVAAVVDAVLLVLLPSLQAAFRLAVEVFVAWSCYRLWQRGRRRGHISPAPEEDVAISEGIALNPENPGTVRGASCSSCTRSPDRRTSAALLQPHPLSDAHPHAILPAVGNGLVQSIPSGISEEGEAMADDEEFELKLETRSRQEYRGFHFAIEDDGEVQLWAETKEAQDVWRNVDSSAELGEDSPIFCGYWRPPSMEALRSAIDALWDGHGPTRD